MNTANWLRSTIALYCLSCTAIACGVTETPEQERWGPVLSCSSSSDCRDDEICLSTQGYCIDSRQLRRSLLVEITPALNDPAYSGAHYYARPELNDEQGSLHQLLIPPRVNVRGSVAADDSLANCQTPPRETLPARLHFTPRETLIGVPVVSFELDTTLDAETQQHIFEGSIPPGDYDIYIRPDSRVLSDECLAVPQLYRGRSVREGEPLIFEQPQLSTLPLSFPWEDNSLNGWLLDMIDPVTGELISNQLTLRDSDVDPETQQLQATLVYSGAQGGESMSLPSELLRLRPPTDQVAGTILIVRSGLVIGSDGRAAVGQVRSATVPVQVQAWIWSDDLIPAPGTVEFSARELDEAADITTAFSVTATSSLQGEVNVALLPGLYRVRKYPSVSHRGGLDSQWSGAQQTLTVYSDVMTQAGQRLSIPDSMNFPSRAVAVSTAAIPIAVPNATAWASASYTDGTGCLRTPENYGQFATANCEAPLTPILSKARARDPYKPRSRSTRVNRDGEFELTGLDCGACSDGRGATFDISVQPDPNSGLAWAVRMRRNIRPIVRTESAFVFSAPQAQAFGLRYAGTEEQQDAWENGQAVRGARVRAFLVLNGALEIAEDLSLPPCQASTELNRNSCLATVIQVAEGQTDANGNWLLLYQDVEL